VRTVTQAGATEVTRELQELGARIDRLRERLRTGDPDMPADEFQAAIDRAETKHRELHDQQPEATQSERALAMLPRAAEMYRRQIAEGLRATSEQQERLACYCVSGFGGRIQLKPLPDGD
jgi:chromosome segregation ATPase